jgi:hypothetical protein
MTAGNPRRSPEAESIPGARRVAVKPCNGALQIRAVRVGDARVERRADRFTRGPAPGSTKTQAARPNVIFAETPSAPSTRSIKSVEMSLVFRLMRAVTRVRDVPASVAA